MWTPCKTKKERREKIRQLLLSNDKAVLRGITAIYARQTYDEQTSDSTKHENGVGFCAFDATLMSSFAKQIDRHGGLTTKQMIVARERIVRYTRQLSELAELHEQRIKNEGMVRS